MTESERAEASLQEAAERFSAAMGVSATELMETFRKLFASVQIANNQMRRFKKSMRQIRLYSRGHRRPGPRQSVRYFDRKGRPVYARR